MITVVSEQHTLHHPPFEYYNGALHPCFETPMRSHLIRTAIEQAGIGQIIPGRSFSLKPILAVHRADYLEYLEHAYDRWTRAGGTPLAVLPDTFAHVRPGHDPSVGRGAPGYYCFDLSAPITAGTYAAARSSADVALTGVLLLREHPVVYALCRPPGHHAGPAMCGGYCFLNNAAIAAAYLMLHRKQPHTRHAPYVAILDLDFHHGNGTQQIFYDCRDVLYISLHADPARQYPYFTGYAEERGIGDGLDYTLNFPLEANIANERYLAVLDQALAAIREHMPRYLIVSMGFDTFIDDPIGDFQLTADVYPVIARRIAALGLPTLIVQEGGYMLDSIGALVVSFLQGFELLT